MGEGTHGVMRTWGKFGEKDAWSEGSTGKRCREGAQSAGGAWKKGSRRELGEGVQSGDGRYCSGLDPAWSLEMPLLPRPVGCFMLLVETKLEQLQR